MIRPSLHPCTLIPRPAPPKSASDASLSAARAGSLRAPRRRRASERRAVASVLAMMFLVIFGSLAAAMAVVAQGNLRTADSSLKVSRAMSAAETGMVFAARRLEQEARRFVVKKGVIDYEYADDLWMGNLPADELTVLPPEGYEVTTPPSGIAEALRDAHLADSHDVVIEAGDAALPEIDEFGTLRVRPIVLGDGPNAAYFRLRYQMMDVLPRVRVTCEGVDQDVSRVLQMDFEIGKKIEYAVISPNRIMIGKNVMVEGPLGSRFGVEEGELDTQNGDPLVLRSDFYYLHPNLDASLDLFFDQVVDYDVDGDNRLRPDHPVESQGLAGYPVLMDYDGDEYVDDYDLFLAQFDTNLDGMVVYDPDLAAEVGLGSLADEFDDIDDQLARLIDEARPDRDGDEETTDSDRHLGYRDGVLDGNDLYAKITGKLRFAVTREAWEAEHEESYQTVVQGPIRAGIDVAPVAFGVAEEELLEITTDMFDDSQTWFEGQVPADPPEDPVNFDQQVTDGIAAGGTYTAPEDNEWEEVPFGSIGGAYDYYQRPVYENMTFRDVRIPRGLNALFVDCTFVGVTYVESETDCVHENWNYAGAVEETEEGVYELKFPDLVAELDGVPIPDTRPWSNNIRFDNCTFLGSVAGDRIGEYTHWRNKLQMTGNTRFYLDPADEELAEQPDAAELIAQLESITPEDRLELSKSSMLMPGWSTDVGNFSNEQAADPEDTPTVQLRGTIICGILDIRGTADVHGTLLMTFRPQDREGPLFYGGQVDAFNTTIGYFGPSDGDSEGMDPDEAGFDGFGEIRLRYDPDALLPDGIPWPVYMAPVTETYWEGGLL